MHHFMFLRDQVVDFLRLLAKTWKGSARARGVVDCSAIVMTKLNENEVTFFHLANHFVPEAFGYECSATTSPSRTVSYVDFGRIEKLNERIAPAETAVCIVLCGRVADNKYRRQLGIDR